MEDSLVGHDVGKSNNGEGEIVRTRIKKKARSRANSDDEVSLNLRECAKLILRAVEQ